MEKKRRLAMFTELFRCEDVEIRGKHLYMFYIKDSDRLAEFKEVVSGTIPKLVVRLKVGDKLVEFYHIVIYKAHLRRRQDAYEEELYIKRITEDRPCRKIGILYISYYGKPECNYVFFYREKDEFGEADEFDCLTFKDMMEEMIRYVEQGAEVLFLSSREYNPVEYKRLVLRAG